MVVASAVGASVAPAAAGDLCGLRLTASAATAAAGVWRGDACMSWIYGFCGPADKYEASECRFSIIFEA